MSFIGISGEKERIKIRIGKAVFRIVVLRALLLAACKTTPLACN